MSHNPCTEKLTDIEYLKHMIPHHQVAIDMSKMVSTRNPVILNLCRNIIRKQGYEIWEMEMMTTGLSDTLFGPETGNPNNLPTALDLYDPTLLCLGRKKEAVILYFLNLMTMLDTWLP